MHRTLYSSLIEIILFCELFNITNAVALKGHNISPANPREFPFIASLGINVQDCRVHVCTGVLISRKHILTAEHCLEDKQPSDFDVIVGEVDLRTAHFRYNVTSWKSFDEWDAMNSRSVVIRPNDIAVVKLSSIVDHPGTRPVSLAYLNDRQLQRKNAVIAGWGATNDDRIPDVLQKATVRILRRKRCEKRLYNITQQHPRIQPSLLCTAADPHTLVTCGDSGGPLLDEHDHLLGIIHGTCPVGYWGPFTNNYLNNLTVNIHLSVDYYKQFIVDVVRSQYFNGCRVRRRVH